MRRKSLETDVDEDTTADPLRSGIWIIHCLTISSSSEVWKLAFSNCKHRTTDNSCVRWMWMLNLSPKICPPTFISFKPRCWQICQFSPFSSFDIVFSNSKTKNVFLKIPNFSFSSLVCAPKTRALNYCLGPQLLLDRNLGIILKSAHISRIKSNLYSRGRFQTLKSFD